MRHGWTAMDRCPGCSAGSPGGRRAMWERCNRRSNKSRSETLFLIDVAEVARPRAMIMIEQPLRRNLARSDDLLKRIKIARFVIARPVDRKSTRLNSSHKCAYPRP